MRPISRAGWILCAALFGTLLSSIVHVDHAGLVPDILLAAFVAFSFLRPRQAIVTLIAAVPVAWYFVSQLWNSEIAWAEALACAALTGLALERTRRPQGRATAIEAPALLLTALVVASLGAGLGVAALRLGPGFRDALLSQLTHEYFTDLQSFTGQQLHTGMLLLSGALFAWHAARLSAERPLTAAAAMAAAAGAALSSFLTLLHIFRVAAERTSFWATLREMVATVRWTAQFADFNAAGSYYAMTIIVAGACAWRARGPQRAAWWACAALIAAGLWLTSSRVAVLAVPVALGAAYLLTQIGRGERAFTRAAAIAVVLGAILLTVAAVLPRRGLQKSSLLATDVRVGLIQTGFRMIRSHPVFGIGLAEFHQRSGEYSSPELLAKFPVAVHENAHNNFVQVAAELGIAGGVVFCWLMAVPLIGALRRAVAANDRFLLMVGAGVGAFALTCLGGHPLLIPEPGYVFWLLAGVIAGDGAQAAGEVERTRATWVARPAVALALAAIVVTVPLRIRARAQDADLEHVGINVSLHWQISPDGIKYREAHGHATLFVPTTAFKFSVELRGDRPERLELRLGGRPANVLNLTPGVWTDIVLPARSERISARFDRLDLRTLESDKTVIWLTKVQEVE